MYSTPISRLWIESMILSVVTRRSESLNVAEGRLGDSSERDPTLAGVDSGSGTGVCCSGAAAGSAVGSVRFFKLRRFSEGAAARVWPLALLLCAGFCSARMLISSPKRGRASGNEDTNCGLSIAVVVGLLLIISQI